MEAKTIDEVIVLLEEIIETSKKEESPLGYFAALYQKVTICVKEKLGTGYFDDDARMELLDVVFANRYLLAYANYRANKANTQSWEVAFNLSKYNDLIVLQHLILGMNAHINLDLGIAAAQISKPSNIHLLESDFNKINDILGELVDDVKSNLSLIWRPLVWILKKLKNVDNFLVNFSMGIARDGAWKFANELILEMENLNDENCIFIRDGKIKILSDQVVSKGKLEKIIFKIIQFTEWGSVSNRIEVLRKKVG